MADQDQNTTLRGIDYASTFEFTRLFRCFRLAISPMKLGFGLLMIVVLFMGGQLMDVIAGGRVAPDEFQAYRMLNGAKEFKDYQDASARNTAASAITYLAKRSPLGLSQASKLIDPEGKTPVSWDEVEAAIQSSYASKIEKAQGPDQKQDLSAKRAAAIRGLEELKPKGVFETALKAKLDVFSRLSMAAVQLRIGLDQLDPDVRSSQDSIIGCLRVLVVELPGWLWHGHMWFTVVWVIFSLLVWALFGGAISRLAVMEAGRDEPLRPWEALCYVARRYRSYVLAPITPALLIIVIGLLMAVVGMLFNVVGLDVIAGLLYVLAIIGGVFMALVLVIGLIGGVHLMYPCLSAEGSDWFDAFSRSFNCVYSRPWKLIFYSLVGLVYGAATYLFVGVLAFVVLYLTQRTTGAWVSGGWALAPADTGGPYFDGIFPPPQFGELAYSPDWESLGPSGKVAAIFTMVWVHIVIGLVGAYAISFYVSAYSVIYLLLRRDCDGTDFSEIYVDPEPEPQPDKVEPAESAAARPETPAAEASATEPAAGDSQTADPSS